MLRTAVLECICPARTIPRTTAVLGHSVLSEIAEYGGSPSHSNRSRAIFVRMPFASGKMHLHECHVRVGYIWFSVNPHHDKVADSVFRAFFWLFIDTVYIFTDYPAWMLPSLPCPSLSSFFFLWFASHDVFSIF